MNENNNTAVSEEQKQEEPIGMPADPQAMMNPYDMNMQPVMMQPEEPGPIKKTMGAVYTGLETAVFSFLTVFSGVLGFMSMIPMLFAISGLFGFMTCFNIFRLRKKRYPRSLIVSLLTTLAVLGLGLFMFAKPASFSSKDTGKYGMQRKYLYSVAESTDILPEELPDFVEDYKLTYKKSLFGSTSWTSVRYRVDPDDKEAWEDLSDMLYSKSFSFLNEYSVKRLRTYEDPEGGYLSGKNFYMKYDEKFWEDDWDDDQTYYVPLKANGTKSNPKTSALIINLKKGMVEFTQLD